MSVPQRRTATYADIEALPPNMVGEIAFGVLHTHPRPRPRHGIAAGEVYSELRNVFGRGGSGGWIFIPEPELHLGGHILVPDIAGWRRENLTPVPDTVGITTRPDWLCEVLSPTTQRFDRTDKLAIYATFGVAHCWYVDPLSHTLEVFELTGGKWLLAATFKDADVVSAPPFGEHAFSLDVLWLDEPPVG